MAEIVFHPVLNSYKDELEKLEKINDKSDDNLRKIFYPDECKCQNSKCTRYCRYKRGLLGSSLSGIYQCKKDMLIGRINDISEMEQKKQNILTNLITKDFNNNLVLNLCGFDSNDIEKIKPYIIKKITVNLLFFNATHYTIYV